VFVLVCSSRLSAQQQSSSPSNVDAGLVSAELRALLRVSDTFRAQCARIAADRRAHVRVSIAYGLESGARAQTTFRRYRSGALFADVEILFGEDYRELLAHEFEHVIEQLDGVDLREEARQGRAWQIDGGAFETRRARLAGLQATALACRSRRFCR
jgi:hypothetical protein